MTVCGAAIDAPRSIKNETAQRLHPPLRQITSAYYFARNQELK